LKDFPETANIEEIRYMIINSAFELAENSIVDRQEERYSDVLKETSEFLRRYPNSSFSKDVRSFEQKAEGKLSDLRKAASNS
jgi:outer membrane protein assembly factor BamD